jgi:integrase
VLEYGQDSNGRRLQTSKAGFPTRAAAQTALQDAVRTFSADVTVHGLTVGEYLTSWLESKHALKPKTVELYESLIRNYLIPHLGRVRLLELRAQHLDSMYVAINVGSRGRPLSATTIRRIHGVLRAALNSAVKRRLIPYSPAEHVELAAENHRRPKPWSSQQAQAFLGSAVADRLHAFYHLLLVTGLRRGEAIGLRWEDIDLAGRCLFVVQQISEVNGELVVGTPKTKRGVRLVPLDSHTVAMLTRHRDGQVLERVAWGPAWNDQGLVFTREDGSPVRPGYATRHFKHLAAVAGLPVIRLHDLRHTNASLALQAGVDLKVVSERLGHSQLAVTADLYTHVHLGLGQDAADRIASTLELSENAVPSAFLAHDPEAAPKEGEDTASDTPDHALNPVSPQVRGLQPPDRRESRRGDSNP